MTWLPCERSATPARSTTSDARSSVALERALFGFAVVGAAVAVVLLIAPTAHHRLVWRSGVKDTNRLLTTANRETLAGLASMAVAIALGVYVVAELVFSSLVAGLAGALLAGLIVWLWLVEPLRTRAEPRSSDRGAPSQP